MSGGDFRGRLIGTTGDANAPGAGDRTADCLSRKNRTRSLAGLVPACEYPVRVTGKGRGESWAVDIGFYVCAEWATVAVFFRVKWGTGPHAGTERGYCNMRCPLHARALVRGDPVRYRSVKMYHSQGLSIATQRRVGRWLLRRTS